MKNGRNIAWIFVSIFLVIGGVLFLGLSGFKLHPMTACGAGAMCSLAVAAWSCSNTQILLGKFEKTVWWLLGGLMFFYAICLWIERDYYFGIFSMILVPTYFTVTSIAIFVALLQKHATLATEKHSSSISVMALKVALLLAIFCIMFV